MPPWPPGRFISSILVVMVELSSPLPGQRTLSEISGDYERAELTVLWVHEPASKRHLHVFALAELCPSEQEPSAGFTSIDKKSNKTVPQQRMDLGSGKTAYVTRLFLENPREAVAFYRGHAGVWRLPEPLATVQLQPPGRLEEEPPSEVPVLVSPNRDPEAFGAVFPMRPVSLRVYSRLNLQRDLERILGPRELEKLNTFALEKLGLDLLRFPEYQGAIHLCMPNPLLRRMHERLTADERQLLVDFLERDGLSVRNCTLELTDLRATGEGFHIRVPVHGAHLAVALPNSPEVLRTRLLDPSGTCIEQTEANFVKSVLVRAHVLGRRRRVHLKAEDGSIKQHEIETVAADIARRTGAKEEPRNADQTLREAQKRREQELLEKNRTFIYFEGGLDSKLRALEIIRELLGQARDRCILCDPYLSASDVIQLVPFVRIQRLPIWLLGSKSFLKMKSYESSKRPAGNTLLKCLREFIASRGFVKTPPVETEGDVLLRQLRELHTQDTTLNLSCRVLRGDKSPVHDRFLVVDDDVYLLGSSLNEFGSRATTLFKAPAPERLIDIVEGWWKDPAISVPLEELRVLLPESPTGATER